MTIWIWQVRMVGGDVREIEATDAELQAGYWQFSTKERYQVQSTHRPFPWSQSEIVTRDIFQDIWVTSINADHVIEVTPVDEVAEQEAS